MNQVLLAVQAGLGRGEARLSSVVRKVLLGQEIELVSISSVYQITIDDPNWRNESDVLKGLATCLLLETGLSAAKLILQMRDLEKNLNKDAVRNRVIIYLLAYAQNVVMSRSLTLPHPELHADPRLLLPAKEVCPDFEHPVLHKTLNELAVDFVDDQWGTFYAQGKSLLEEKTEPFLV